MLRYITLGYMILSYSSRSHLRLKPQHGGKPETTQQSKMARAMILLLLAACPVAAMGSQRDSSSLYHMIMSYYIISCFISFITYNYNCRFTAPYQYIVLACPAPRLSDPGGGQPHSQGGDHAAVHAGEGRGRGQEGAGGLRAVHVLLQDQRRRPGGQRHFGTKITYKRSLDITTLSQHKI